MEEKAEGYFSDKKNWVSLLAVVISSISLIVAGTSLWWTYHNQQDQNHRWDALNLPRVELSEVGFIIWRELPPDEALKTDWGYKASLITKLEKRVVQQLYQIPYELVLFDTESSQIVPNTVSFFTVAKGKEEIARLNLREREAKIEFYKPTPSPK